jgi:hypothetical protein
MIPFAVGALWHFKVRAPTSPVGMNRPPAQSIANSAIDMLILFMRPSNKALNADRCSKARLHSYFEYCTMGLAKSTVQNAPSL